jgi:lanosterol synthase
MCYLYGIKFKAEENDLIRALREVMYHKKTPKRIQHPAHRILLVFY